MLLHLLQLYLRSRLELDWRWLRLGAGRDAATHGTPEHLKTRAATVQQIHQQAHGNKAREHQHRIA